LEILARAMICREAAVEWNGLPARLELGQLRVVLVDVRNPLNIGAVARAMSNFGFSRLRVVNPYDVAFESARSAVKAGEILANAQKFQTLAEAVSDCSLVVGTTAIGHRDLQHTLQRLEAGAPIIQAHLAAGPCALLFGSEKFGLSNQDMSHCHWLMHIPTREQHLSMNLGQAVAICLYELIRDSSAPVQPELGNPATSAEVERIFETLLAALRGSDYPKLNTSDTFQSAVRRLVYRLRLESGDSEFLLGMLRQVVWKLEKDKVEIGERQKRKIER
jgi:TrmH family RNA methyltransferase